MIRRTFQALAIVATTALLSTCAGAPGTSTSKHPTVGDAAAAANPPPALEKSLSVFDLPSPFERPQ